MLPSASNTCRYLTKETSDTRKRIRPQNRKLTTTADINRIIQAFQEKRLSLLKFSKVRSIPKRKHINQWLTRWYDKHHNNDSDNSGSGSGSATNLYGLQRCLSSEALQQFKHVSWNFLLQQVLLVRMHNTSRRQRRRRGGPTSNLFESSSSTRTGHLVLSSHYNQHEPTTTRKDNDHDHDSVFYDSLITSIKGGHDQLFDEYVATERICEMDIDKLYNNKEFLKEVIFR